MMAEVQLNVHTFVDNEGGDHCHEKKIVSGDNKTEKNMHYGILISQYHFLKLLNIIIQSFVEIRNIILVNSIVETVIYDSQHILIHWKVTLHS